MVVKHSVVITVTVHVKELAIMHVTILVPMIVVLDALAIARVLVLEHLQAHPLVHTVTIPVKEIVRELVLEPLKVQPLVLDQVVRQAALISVQLLVDIHATIHAMTHAKVLQQDRHLAHHVLTHVKAHVIPLVLLPVKERHLVAVLPATILAKEIVRGLVLVDALLDVQALAAMVVHQHVQADVMDLAIMVAP